MAEVRIQREGTLRSVQASGTGRDWATASASVGALLGFVDSFSFTSGQTITTIMDRGDVSHHKITQRSPIDLTVNYKWTGSAQVPSSGSGATVPMYNMEFRASAAEYAGAPSGFFYQFHGAALQSTQFTENAEGDVIAATYRCLGMNGPTASGYLS